MIETIKNIINLAIKFLNYLFNFKIEFAHGEEVSLGIIVVAFLFIVFTIYLVLQAVGLNGGNAD